MTSATDLSCNCEREIPADSLIRSARAGESETLGKLLQSYRNYLQLLATTQIDRKLQPRISPSDLVQETMLGAYRDFAQFRGQTERELLGWLRQILINNLRVFVQKHVLAEKRDVRREVSLEKFDAALERSTADLRTALADRGPSPSTDSMRRESALLLANHLARMPVAYRDVLVLRNLQGLSFTDVAQQMQRSSGSVRMLWMRAIRHLREQMDLAGETSN